MDVVLVRDGYAVGVVEGCVQKEYFSAGLMIKLWMVGNQVGGMMF